MTATYDAAVRAWAAELRGGSRRTWREFLSSPSEGAVLQDPLPTAAQLEVVRRLPHDVGDFAGLADLVLATPASWRGRIDVPLPWDEAPRFGTPPVDPSVLHPDELLRVVGSAITTLLLEEPPQERPQQRGFRLFLKRFVLLGAPGTAAIVGAEMRRQGWHEGGPKPAYVVLGGPLEKLMAQRWAVRVRLGSTIRWRPFWRYAKNHDRIPPGIQAAALASRLAAQVGGQRVHLVLASTTQEAMTTVADLLGLEHAEVPEPAQLLGTDLLRVVNAPLTLAAGEEQRARLVTEVWPELTRGQVSRPVGAPRPYLDWAISAAEREVEHIVRGARSAGYAVHGDPGVVVPDPKQVLTRAIPRRDTLELGLTVLGRAWNRHLERGGA